MSSNAPSSIPTPPGSGAASSSEQAGSSTTAGDTVRRILRSADRATLATALRAEAAPGAAVGSVAAGAAGEGWPYPSLVLVALDHDATPLLLISTLADHTKNIAADARVGLLFDATAGLAQPLAGARVSLLGRAEPSDEPRHRARFLARHPGAAFYAGFGDFAIYKVSIDRAHLVAGFGRVRWLDRAALAVPEVPAELAAAEADIVAHMNTDHLDAVQRFATALAGQPAGNGEGPWLMTGIDPEGCDLRCGGSIARVDFDQRVTDAASAKVALVKLARAFRSAATETDATLRPLEP